MTQKPKSLSRAINWVTIMHDGDYRKGMDMPYVSHVFGVSTLLMLNGVQDEAILIGALLHDVVEDTDVTLEEVKELFGDLVADYVDWLSEDKSKTWEERKKTGIAHISHMPSGAKWIKLADKVNNLELMNVEVQGEGMDWSKFNRGYEDQKWYYTSVFDAFGAEEDLIGTDLLAYGLSLLNGVFGGDGP